MDYILNGVPENGKEQTRENLNQVAVYDLSLFRSRRRNSRDGTEVELEGHKFGPLGENNRAELPFSSNVELSITGAGAFPDAYVSSPVHSGINQIPLSEGVTDIEVDPRLLFVDRNRANNKVRIH